MLREDEEKAPLTAPCCCPGVGDEDFREGGLLNCGGGGVRFRNRAILVGLVYGAYFVLAIVSVSVAAASREGGAVAFATMVALVVPSLHFLTSILAFLSCLLYTSPSPRDRQKSRMPSSA